MSKPKRIPDAERTATMCDLLRRKYIDDKAMSLSHVMVEEVAPGTGFYGANRFADVLILGIWKADATLRGYEIKASRADLKRELSDLSKHEAVARYCDTWTLLAWDESVLVDGIPDTWGVTVTVEGEHGRELKVIRKPTLRVAEPWPRHFVCSMVRNAYQQAPGAAYVARAVMEARDLGREEYKRTLRRNLSDAVKPIARVLYGTNEWRWPAEAHDAEKLIQIAAERLMQGTLSLTEKSA